MPRTGPRTGAFGGRLNRPSCLITEVSRQPAYSRIGAAPLSAPRLRCRYEASAPTRARAGFWDLAPGQTTNIFGPGGPAAHDLSYVQDSINFATQLIQTYCPRSALVAMSMLNEPNVRHQCRIATVLPTLCLLIHALLYRHTRTWLTLESMTHGQVFMEGRIALRPMLKPYQTMATCTKLMAHVNARAMLSLWRYHRQDMRAGLLTRLRL